MSTCTKFHVGSVDVIEVEVSILMPGTVSNENNINNDLAICLLAGLTILPQLATILMKKVPVLQLL